MRCPVCKADNDESPQCRRCKADLSLLAALECRRGRVLAEAVGRLAGADAQGALAAARTADAIRRDAESQRVLAIARLFSRDFAGAWASYREQVAEPPS
jgi:hypothetical protein